MECVCVYRGTEEQGLRVSWWCSVCVYLFIGELFWGVLWCVCVFTRGLKDKVEGKAAFLASIGVREHLSLVWEYFVVLCNCVYVCGRGTEEKVGLRS